jgi:hypothetical protein
MGSQTKYRANASGLRHFAWLLPQDDGERLLLGVGVAVGLPAISLGGGKTFEAVCCHCGERYRAVAEPDIPLGHGPHHPVPARSPHSLSESNALASVFGWDAQAIPVRESQGHPARPVSHPDEVGPSKAPCRHRGDTLEQGGALVCAQCLAPVRRFDVERWD